MNAETQSPGPEAQLSELERLERLGQELAACEERVSEPGMVLRLLGAGREAKFGRNGQLVIGELTLGGWLELCRVDSPVLSGRWPADQDERLAALTAAVAAFGDGTDAYGLPITTGRLITVLEPREVGELILTMEARVIEALSYTRKMRWPNLSQPGMDAPERRPGGWGMVLPIYTRLRRDFGLSREAALATPLGEALALVAVTLFQEGFEVDGPTYAQEDVKEKLKR